MARQVKGYRTMCPLERLRRVSSEIMREHILAAEYLRRRYDGAKHGFTAPKDDAPVTQIVYLPKMDFSATCYKQAHAVEEFRRIWKTLQPRQQRMAYFVLLQNYSVDAWCKVEGDRVIGRPLNRQRELGKLVGMLDHLAKYLDREIDDEIQSGMMLKQ